MKQPLILTLVFVAISAGCPRPEPVPMPMNTFTFNHDIPARLVTILKLGFSDESSNDPADYTFDGNLLINPLLPGQSVTFMDLPEGYYYVKMETIPLGLPGSTHYKCFEWGLIEGNINPSLNSSVLSFCT